MSSEREGFKSEELLDVRPAERIMYSSCGACSAPVWNRSGVYVWCVSVCVRVCVRKRGIMCVLPPAGSPNSKHPHIPSQHLTRPNAFQGKKILPAPFPQNIQSISVCYFKSHFAERSSGQMELKKITGRLLWSFQIPEKRKLLSLVRLLFISQINTRIELDTLSRPSSYIYDQLFSCQRVLSHPLQCIVSAFLISGTHLPLLQMEMYCVCQISG